MDFGHLDICCSSRDDISGFTSLFIFACLLDYYMAFICSLGVVPLALLFFSGNLKLKNISKLQSAMLLACFGGNAELYPLDVVSEDYKSLYDRFRSTKIIFPVLAHSLPPPPPPS